jgi:hypothetical protein
MGTNYYAVRNRPSVSEPIHIGKSSAGWLFCFQAHNDTWEEPPVVWNTYAQVKAWLYKHTVEEKDFVILDEYDKIVSFEDFVALVDKKQADEHNRSNPNNFSYSRNVDGYRFSDGNFC